MSQDISKLTMTEIIRQQDLLSKELTRRFEKLLALTFSDVCDSTAYFAKYGDEEGRKLQQRHFDLISQCLPQGNGRVVDTSGDGAFLCFPTVEECAASLIALDKLISTDNMTRPKNQHLRIRLGVHWGKVLTDGDQVNGENVNLCARVASAARPGEIRLTREAFQELRTVGRLMCTAQPVLTELKGVGRPVETMVLDWRDPRLFPDRLVVQETTEEIRLPQLDTITFGRLRDSEGAQGNDIVLNHSDPEVSKKISRWHFEIRRQPDGLVLHQISEAPTEVDGAHIPRGGQARVKQDSVVKVGQALTLIFKSKPAPKSSESTTFSF